jgi:hypothetical protein
MTMNTTDSELTVARERIGVAAAAAILVAGLILVTIVLPAEYGADPLGTGARLGLLELGVIGQQVEALDATTSTTAAAQAAIIVGQKRRPFTNDTQEFVLGPREGIEYKYRLEKGEALLYAWTASEAVNYELHAEPDGAPRGYAQSYEKRDATREASGTLTAPFSGIHGWFWENTTNEPIKVTLRSAGYYNLAHEFRSTGITNKTFN